MTAFIFALAIQVGTIGPHPVMTARECHAAYGVIIRGHDADGLLSSYCSLDNVVIAKVLG